MPLIAAVALALMPMAALAQSSSGSVSAHRMPSGHYPLTARAPSSPRVRAALVAPIRTPKALASATAREAPLHSFEVRAKPEWSDDQGFRIDATRLAYKSRF